MRLSGGRLVSYQRRKYREGRKNDVILEKLICPSVLEPSIVPPKVQTVISRKNSSCYCPKENHMLIYTLNQSANDTKDAGERGSEMA